MPNDDLTATTNRLGAAGGGDAAAADQLMMAVYGELHDLARWYLRRETPGHTLRPTALVHEAYLKMIDQQKVDWQGRTHFLAVAAQAMRRVLVDHARSKKRKKRGGSRRRLTLDEQLVIHRDCEEDIVAVDDALESLARLDAQQARIVEMRFFAGMKVDEVAAALGVSKRSVEREWTAARAWLRQQLSEDQPS